MNAQVLCSLFVLLPALAFACPACLAGDTGEGTEDVGETQEALICNSVIPTSCDDGNACTIDTCGRNGLCSYSPVCPTGYDCFEGQCSPACTSITACDAYCNNQANQTPCNICGMGGECVGGHCHQIESGPPYCG